MLFAALVLILQAQNQGIKLDYSENWHQGLPKYETPLPCSHSL